MNSRTVPNLDQAAIMTRVFARAMQGPKLSPPEKDYSDWNLVELLYLLWQRSNTEIQAELDHLYEAYETIRTDQDRVDRTRVLQARTA